MQIYSKDTPTQVLSCKICKIFKNASIVKHLRMAAFDGSESNNSENDDESYNESIEAVVCNYSSK